VTIPVGWAVRVTVINRDRGLTHSAIVGPPRVEPEAPPNTPAFEYAQLERSNEGLANGLFTWANRAVDSTSHPPSSDATRRDSMTGRLLVAALLLAPSIAFAQRGSGRTQADRKTDLFPKEEMSKGPTLRVRDVEEQSPLKLLIEKRKDLKLTDAQFAQFKSAEDKFKEQNAPLFKSLDSYLRDLKNAASSPSDEARTKGRDARSGIMEVLKELRTNYDASLKDLLAPLDADQQAKANQLVEKQREEGDKMLREKLAGVERS